MDIIDSVLDGLQLHSTVFARLELTGDWGFAKSALPGAPFHIILSGEAWIELAFQSKLFRLRPGDVVILPKGEAHNLMAKPGATLVPFQQVLAKAGSQRWTPGIRIKPTRMKLGTGDGPITHMISGVFGFGDRRENPLLEALPRLFHLKADQADEDSPRAWLRSTLKSLETEVDSGRPGAGAVAARLADILLIQAVRTYLATSTPKYRGWLRGMVDPRLSRVLSQIHAHPERSWSVATLAAVASMSRSRFAAYFQEVIGQTPIDYLTGWRMYNAAGDLMSANIGLTVMAEKAGYKSEVAFSKAFKRWAGCSPATYKRRTKARG